MDRRKRSDRESRELSASRAGKLRGGLEIQPDFQLSAYVHLALDHFPPTAQPKGLPEKNICLHTHKNLPACASPKLPGPRILRSPRTPAAASGAGFGGAQLPLSNRFFPPTQNVEEPKRRAGEPSIHRFSRETQRPILLTDRELARGSCVASDSARLLRSAAATHPASRFFLSPSRGFRMPPYPGTMFGIPGTTACHS